MYLEGNRRWLPRTEVKTINWAQILRTLELPVCLFVPVELINLQRFMIPRLGQFTENYGDPFVTIYRDFLIHLLFCK